MQRSLHKFKKVWKKTFFAEYLSGQLNIVIIKPINSESDILKRQGFILSSVILILSVLITKVIGIIYRIPLANLLGGSGMAYFSSAHSAFMPVYALAVSGITPAIAKLVSQLVAQGRYRDAVRLRHSSLTFFLFTSSAATGLLIVLSKLISVSVVNEPLSRLSIVAIAPCVTVGAVTAVERGYAEGLRNMLPTAISEIIEAAVKLIAGLSLAAYTKNRAMLEFAESGCVFGMRCQSSEEAMHAALPYIAAASVLGITIANLIAYIYTYLSARFSKCGISPELLSHDSQATPKGELVRSVLRLSMPFALAALISTVSGVIDLVTVNHCLERACNNGLDSTFFGDFVLGSNERLESFIYGSYSGLALTVFGIIPSLTAMLGKSALPLVSSACAVNDRERLRESIRAVILPSLMVSVPCGLGISIFSKEILEFLFSGRDFEIEVARRALSVLGIASIALSVVSPLMSVLQATGSRLFPIIITVSGSAVKLILNCALVVIPHINITGAAIATLFSYVLMLILCCLRIRAVAGKGAVSARNPVSVIFASVLSCEGAYLLYSVLSNCLSMRFSLIFSVMFSVNIYIYSIDILSVLPKYRLKAYFSR